MPLSRGKLGFGFLLLLVVFTLQVSVAGIVSAWTKVFEGPCAAAHYSVSGGYVRLNVSCAGRSGWTDDAGVIARFLNLRGAALRCSLWASGKARCEVVQVP